MIVPPSSGGPRERDGTHEIFWVEPPKFRTTEVSAVPVFERRRGLSQPACDNEWRKHTDIARVAIEKQYFDDHAAQVRYYRVWFPGEGAVNTRLKKTLLKWVNDECSKLSLRIDESSLSAATSAGATC